MKTPVLFASLVLVVAASAQPLAAAEPQIRIQSKFIETAENEDVKSAILSDRAFQILIRDLSQKKGVDLLTAPSVLTRSGQAATVEVVREIPVPSHHKGDAGKEFETIKTGVTLAVDAVIKGGDVHLIGKAVVREQDPVPAPSKLSFLKSKAAKAKGPFIASFNTTETVFDTILKNGETIVIACRQSDRLQGRLLIAVTATLVDPSGQPMKTADAAPARSKITIAGKNFPFK